jgi:hypothetical protein
MGVTIPKIGLANAGTVTRLNSPRDNASLGEIKKTSVDYKPRFQSELSFQSRPIVGCNIDLSPFE